jgi:serine/threonine-protein kinase
LDIDVGKKIAGKYELVRLLGRGAMGEVWLATHESLGGEFAVKLVKPSDDIEDETAAGRFQLEAQVSARLSRKTRHIVSVSDHGEEDGLAYLVMEVLEGESLEARLKRETLPLPELVGIAAQIGRALSIAHAEGIFHRDLKPANVYLTKDEDGRLLVKLLDFGIARVGPGGKPMRTRSPFATGKDMVLGTPSYMSPEQARGLDTLDYRCDIWALAVVAYEALTRKLPWDGETVEDIFLAICTHKYVPIRDRRADLPDAIDAVFAKAFAPKLDDRYVQATDLVASLEMLVSPDDVDAAIGKKPYAPSINRLDARGSDPQLRLNTPQEIAPRSSDAMALAVGGDTVQIPKHKTGAGWIVGVGAAVATVALIVVLLLAFGGKRTVAGPPAETTATTTIATREVPPPDTKTAPPNTVGTTPAPTTTTTATATPRVARTDPHGARVTPPTTAGAAPPPPATTTQAAPPPPPPPATTSPAKPPPEKDKSQVF